jgi:hypothetical protein
MTTVLPNKTICLTLLRMTPAEYNTVGEAEVVNRVFRNRIPCGNEGRWHICHDIRAYQNMEAVVWRRLYGRRGRPGRASASDGVQVEVLK